jgi:hypothetical protein
MTPHTDPTPNPRPSAAKPKRPSESWTPARIRALGAVTDIPTAGAILGLSRSAAYDLAGHDEFPVPVIHIGARYRVPVAALLTALHIPIETPPTGSDLTIADDASVDHHDRNPQGTDPHPTP